MRIAAARPEIVDRVLVRREEAAGRAIFGRHVRHCRPVFERQRVEPVAGIFDELAHHALLAQHLRDRQNEVGRGHALTQSAREPEADDLGDQHGNRLAQHRRLGLDAAHAPAKYREAIYHGRVAVGADECIGESLGDAALLLRPNGLREIFEVYLMANAGSGRHDAEIRKGAAAPAQELVALLVALVFEIGVDLERARAAKAVNHHGMIDDQIDRHQRIDFGGVAVKGGHRVSHRGQIHHGGHAGKVLHQDAGGPEGDFARGAFAHEPLRHGADVFRRDRAAVLEAQEVFQKNLQRVGQGGNSGQAVRLGVGQREILIGLALHMERFAGAEAVERARS